MTGPGQSSAVVLPEGTHVSRSQNTRLTYAETIVEGVGREVWLDGDATFDVAHRDGTPFTVRTDNALVMAEGTVFTVHAPLDSATLVTVNEGTVWVRSLTGGQSTVLATGEHVLVSK